MKFNWKIGTTLAGSLMLLSACGGGHDPDRPNIVMILADDLGYSDIASFGGEISTPNLDALAASGRVMTNFHTGAVCSPTRAMLMSGTDQHVTGLGTMAEVDGILIAQNLAPWGPSNTYNYANLPDGYEGYLNPRVVALPRLFKDGGYHTYMAGKWHLAQTPASPAENGGAVVKAVPSAFPMAKGFERSFALLQGAGSHFAPVAGKPMSYDLQTNYVEDDQPATLPANFYSSSSYTDKLISYIDSNKTDKKPFFAYLAFTAPHWPLQAPDEDIAKYAGKYDEGYEVIKARRIARQKQLGLIPAGFTPNPGVDTVIGRPTWGALTASQKAQEARKMEVYAAMIENMDRNIGRLVKYLKDNGLYENTMIVFASDNGAEGGATNFANNANADNSLGNIGRPLSNVTYGERWAEVSAAPFRLWKGHVSEGGTSSPTIVHMPKQTAALPSVTDYTHVADLLPTFLEIAKIPMPGSSYQGQTVKPITGLSLLARLDGTAASGPRTTASVIGGEFTNERYLIRDGYKLMSLGTPFGDYGWELYNLNTDRGETINLAATDPDRVTRMAADYASYAASVGVVSTPIALPRAPAP